MNQWTNESVNQWICESMNQSMSKLVIRWINEAKNRSESTNQWIDYSVKLNQWSNEAMNHWIGEPMKQRSNESINQWTNEPMNEWTSESVIPRIHESRNKWMNESMDGWMDGRTHEWMNECYFFSDPLLLSASEQRPFVQLFCIAFSNSSCNPAFPARLSITLCCG